MAHFDVNPKQIRFGAIVRLKSGSPNMLVVDVIETGQAVWCAWPTSHGEVEEVPFFVTSLMQLVE